ncbi:MAG: zinc-finger domain-containing protein [Methylophaga sp.]|nr:zinc-finger domain-containing protein [Methylophaga sp.]
MSENTSCAQQRYEVHSSDLPLSCPMPNTSQWDAHPKVYLDIQTNSEVACPYCGAIYVLLEQ